MHSPAVDGATDPASGNDGRVPSLDVMPTSAPSATDVPTFALTIDTELVWGFCDLMTADGYSHRYPETRRTYESLLRLLDTYEIPATWAIVGHLFLRECRHDADGEAHPGLAGPTRPDGRPWYSIDPGTNREADPLWYGDDIVDAIASAGVAHEIACHSFGHVPYGHPEMTTDAVRADLQACVDAAAQRGIVLRSFVYPRNWEGHHEALLAAGFRAYRGADPEWYGPLPHPLRRVAHMLENAIAAPPPVSHPTERLPGLWNIPGSGALVPRDGAWRLVPRASRVAKARKGVARAAAERGVFHLWTHPCNIATDEPFMLRTLDAILADVAAARDRGDLVVDTMAGIADRMAGRRADARATEGTDRAADRSSEALAGRG